MHRTDPVTCLFFHDVIGEKFFLFFLLNILVKVPVGQVPSIFKMIILLLIKKLFQNNSGHWKTFCDDSFSGAQSTTISTRDPHNCLSHPISLDKRKTKRAKFNSKWNYFLTLYTGSPSSKYVVYATASAYRAFYRKISDRKKNCVNTYLI